MRAEYGVFEVGRVTSDIVLANNDELAVTRQQGLDPGSVRHIRVKGIVDTGANHIVLPKTIADQLKLPVQGTGTVRHADNRTATREIVRELWLEVCGRNGVYRAIVEPNRETVLIGVLVLEDLDLIVDPGREKLVPRDPEHLTTVIE
jgi:predicted aspartyl protease